MHFSISLFRYGMLYSPYGQRRWFWEAIIASRKALIVLVTSLFDDAGQEVHWLILFLAISIMCNLYMQPYIGAIGITDAEALGLQRFDSGALFVLLATSWSGVYFDINQECSSKYAVACSVLLVSVVGLNVAFLCYCMYHFRNKLVSVKYFVVDVLSCGKKHMLEKSRRATQKRNSTHRNPLRYRATLVKKQTFENPLYLREGVEEASYQNPLRLKKRLEKEAVDAEWQQKVVEMRSMRAKSNADRRNKIKKIASFKLQQKKREEELVGVGGEDVESLWVKAVDPESGKEFYYNIETNEAVWEHPDAFGKSVDT